MLPNFDAKVTPLGRNQTLSEESLPYQLKLRQHFQHLRVHNISAATPSHLAILSSIVAPIISSAFEKVTG
jgi:hypothetical protein